MRGDGEQDALRRLTGGVLRDMNKQTNLPVEGKVIRFAPGRNQEPATSLWKVWAEGSEVYALSRSFGGVLKISVHRAGRFTTAWERN
jgi:hypothetical protein